MTWPSYSRSIPHCTRRATRRRTWCQNTQPEEWGFSRRAAAVSIAVTPRRQLGTSLIERAPTTTRGESERPLFRRCIDYAVVLGDESDTSGIDDDCCSHRAESAEPHTSIEQDGDCLQFEICSASRSRRKIRHGAPWSARGLPDRKPWPPSAPSASRCSTATVQKI